MSNGVEAMRQQRDRRGKPPPMHPRQSGGEGEQQTETAPQNVADEPTPAPAGEQSTQAKPATQESTQRRATRSGGSKGASKSGKATGKAKQAPATAADADGGAVGKAQGKQVSDVALSWAAAARKEAERAELVRGSVEVARQAGTPEHVLLSALRTAEYRAGVALPAEVWQAAGLTSN